MRPVSASYVVDRPREQVFDYLADVANHVEFADHFLKDFRLERLDSRGIGAGARFRIAFPLGGLWAGATLTESEPPYRLLLAGRAGRIGRIPMAIEYLLTTHDQGMTRVTARFSTEPASVADRLREGLGMRSWVKRQLTRALRRLRHVLEDGDPAANAVRVAAG